MWRLQGALAEIAGLPHVSLQPSAGSQGELAGLLLTRAYHEDRGEHRHKVLTPDTAHGTNPATVTMSGYEVVKVGTDADGGVDLDDLREKATEDVACLMLTNPNTLGLFDRNIEEIARIVHDVGATLYYDGANLNAVMGIVRPGDTGFDIVHFNLHKTFTQPHGGGGPGAGPIAVSDRIEPFLPAPQVVRRDGDNGSGPRFDLDFDRPRSIGKLRGFQGNFGVFVRAYAYIRSLGGDGLEEASRIAVLNANYLKARLAEEGVAEYLPVAYDRTCMHEFVLSGRGARDQLGVKTLDLAKRLLDHGVHPPTVYFPLLVEEALMIEPTETETKERLDQFADAVREILEEAAQDPEIARNAPYTTPVRRLDEAGAAKRPVVRQARAPSGTHSSPSSPQVSCSVVAVQPEVRTLTRRGARPRILRCVFLRERPALWLLCNRKPGRFPTDDAQMSRPRAERTLTAPWSSSAASSPPGASTWATTWAPSRSTWRGRTGRTPRSTASWTCTPPAWPTTPRRCRASCSTPRPCCWPPGSTRSAASSSASPT